MLIAFDPNLSVISPMCYTQAPSVYNLNAQIFWGKLSKSFIHVWVQIKMQLKMKLLLQPVSYLQMFLRVNGILFKT